MTSFSEEFFGIRFHREKLSQPYDPVFPPAASPPKQAYGVTNIENNMGHYGTGAVQADDADSFEGPPSRLLPQQLPEDVALAVGAVVLPQLAELERRFEQTMQFAVASATQVRLSPEEVQDLASAVASALRPSLEQLEQLLSTGAPVLSSGMDAGLTPISEPLDSDAIASRVVAELRPMFAELGQHVSHAQRSGGLGSLQSAPDAYMKQQDLAVAVNTALEPCLESLEAQLLAATIPIRQRSTRSKNSLPPSDTKVGFEGRPRPLDLDKLCEESLALQSRNPDLGLTPASIAKAVASSSPQMHKTPMHGVIEKLPSRAFVVNFRRLILVKKIFDVIHSFITSTAIAALTLVDGGNKTLLMTSIIFLFVVLGLYAIHIERYDSLDISDFKQLSELLDDDSKLLYGAFIENPNRILKALAISRSKRRRLRSFLGTGAFMVACMFMWTVIGLSWFQIELDGFWFNLTGDPDTEDHMHRVTLLLVVSLMLGFHLSFEWLYWRETQCVMRAWDDAAQTPWDVRKHGLPWSHRWLGLPSMWFTSHAAYRDLRLWITLARMPNKSCIISKMFPEEMALLALDGAGASVLRHSLRKAKLYDVETGQFLTRRGSSDKAEPVRRGEEPDALELDLVLFDASTNQYFQPGEESTRRLQNLVDVMQPTSRTVSRLVRHLTNTHMVRGETDTSV